ncbi:MAG: rRNA maturation RNase YbeY [bacterium]
MKYEIFKEKNIKVNSKEIDDAVKNFTKLFKIDAKNYLSIAFVLPNTIKKLNYKYRKIDKVTDVLSFGSQQDLQGKQSIQFFDPNFIGEIIICHKQAVRQAKDNGISERQEIKKLLTHGLVHLMGYDHKTKAEEYKMRTEETKILGNIFYD